MMPQQEVREHFVQALRKLYGKTTAQLEAAAVRCFERRDWPRLVTLGELLIDCQKAVSANGGKHRPRTKIGRSAKT
jgi:hypothetical protein